MVKAGLCDTCKMVVGFIKPYVDSDATEKEVNTTLETICGLLPSSANTEVCETHFHCVHSPNFVIINFHSVRVLLPSTLVLSGVC